MKLADSHIHLFRHGYRHDGLPPLFGSGELDAYLALRKAHGVELALVIGYEADGIDPQNNAYIREVSAAHGWLRTVAYVDPNSNPAPNIIQALLDQGHCGLALYVTDAERAQALLRWPGATWDILQARRAVISFNARPQAMDLLRPLVAAVDGVSFLFSHLGLPGHITPEIDHDLLRGRLAPLLSLANLRNAYVKISGLYATSEPAHRYPHHGAYHAIRSIIEAFGSSRCLWGSDFAPALEFVSFPQTVWIPGIDELKDAERNSIFRDNLVLILGG